MNKYIYLFMNYRVLSQTEIKGIISMSMIAEATKETQSAQRNVKCDISTPLYGNNKKNNSNTLISSKIRFSNT